MLCHHTRPDGRRVCWFRACLSLTVPIKSLSKVNMQIRHLLRMFCACQN